MSIKLMPLFLFPTLFVMSGCALGSTVPATVSDYCAIAKPIGYDGGNDTAATVKQIEAHNSQWVCVCEHDCPSLHH